ncbi:MAG: hypothetical protein JXA68_07670 [Ignavibacteriales bacterium]|nr:hypothetical protein [Ignavibacteriales bacterium]
MNKQKLVIIIIAALGVVSTFLPWATVKLYASISINGTNGGDGWITLGLFAIAGTLSLIGDRKRPLNGTYKIITMVAGLVAAVVGILNIVNMRSKLSEISNQNFFGDQLKDMVSTGFGLWLIVICGLALAIVIYLMREKKPDAIPTNSQQNQ